MIEWFKSRGMTDRLYILNFICTHLVVASVIALTALQGILQITDLSALSAVATCAYAELGIHSGFIIWKAKNENIKKFNGGDENGEDNSSETDE